MVGKPIKMLLEIWVQIVKSIKILKFDRNSRNQSKFWNLSAKCPINQNVAIWVNCQTDQNVAIWVKSRNQSKSYTLNKVVWINQNVEIPVQMSNRSNCCNLSEKVGISLNVEFRVQNVKSIKMLHFKWKILIKMLQFE